MKPSSEVEEASGEEVGMGERMEGVVEAVEAMVTAVEMREWLEMGRTETERTAAVHFFSRALACLKWTDQEEIRHHALPLYWPGHLPGLVQLLADCLLPHNPKAIQSGAIHSLIQIGSQPWPHTEPQREMLCESHVSENLLRLASESDDIEIRDQASYMLARMIRLRSFRYPENCLNRKKDFLPPIIALIREYAAIQEPTDVDLSSLSNAIKALTCLGWYVENSNPEPQIVEILPVLIGIFSEPGKRKSVQMQAGEFLRPIALLLDGNLVLESGMIEMLLDMLRVGKDSTAVLDKALEVIFMFLRSSNVGTRQKVLDMGILDVIHLVLKRPNDSFKTDLGFGSLWSRAMGCLRRIAGFAEQREAILNQEGLMELVLEMALGMDMSKETKSFHRITIYMLRGLTDGCTAKQLRRLMFKGPLIRLLARYLNEGDINAANLNNCLATIRACLALQDSERELNLMRRLIDDAGITDALRRISNHPSDFDNDHLVQDILDTYFNNPLPPLPNPTLNLPSVIYTKNVPL